MKPFQFKTLQQRTVIMVLIPTFIILSAMGWGGYLIVKKNLLTQWSETAIANMQKAAHSIDMRLSRPKELLQRLKYNSGRGMAHLTFRDTLDQLSKLDGVNDIKVEWLGQAVNISSRNHMGGMAKNPFYSRGLDLSPPRYRWNSERSTVVLYSQLSNAEGHVTGSIQLEISVSDLVEQLARSDWWKSNKTLLIDKTGNIIAHSAYNGEGKTENGGMIFGSNDPLERLTLNKIQENLHGTVFGEGNPPREISGYYRLSDPPWFMVVLAPGETVLEPIFQFRLYYSILFATAILLIIVFIRSMTTKVTTAIQKVSIAADALANGHFGQSLSVESKDEIGELTKSFNKMTAQLKQGMELQKAMEIAREVQQNFLPTSRYTDEYIEIFGSSRYCKETGGDFFDLVQFDSDENKVGAIVGDVVGHGIGAALLMASVRAMLRTRNEQNGDLGDIVGDVNKVLCRDTAASSSFVTLFYICANLDNNTLQWVRAGHDPGFMYYPDRHEFVELRGKGAAMGVESNFRYESNVIDILPEKQLVVVGSDGAWEAENKQGEQFSKDRIKRLLSEYDQYSPEQLIVKINKEIDAFLDGIPPQDDITFTVMKIDGEMLHSLQS